MNGFKIVPGCPDVEFCPCLVTNHYDWPWRMVYLGAPPPRWVRIRYVIADELARLAAALTGAAWIALVLAAYRVPARLRQNRAVHRRRPLPSQVPNYTATIWRRTGFLLWAIVVAAAVGWHPLILPALLTLRADWVSALHQLSLHVHR